MKKITRDSKILLIYLLVILPIFCVIYIWYTNSTNNVTKVAETVATEPKVVTPQPPTVSELLRLVNAERLKTNASPLVIDERLNQSAQFKADDMFTNNYFGHADPTTGKRNGLEKVWELTAHACTYASENLTQNTQANDSRSAVKAWVSSPAHYQAMIDPEYTLTGFGISDSYITEHFCKQ